MKYTIKPLRFEKAPGGSLATRGIRHSYKIDTATGGGYWLSIRRFLSGTPGKVILRDKMKEAREEANKHHLKQFKPFLKEVKS